MQEKMKSVELEALIPGSNFFRWREALWCNKWGVFVFPTQLQFENIIKLAAKMDAIRNRLGKPITVTSWLRPSVYNFLVNGNLNSEHLRAAACDFSVATMTADSAREMIFPELERLHIRCENLPGSSWVHIDLRPPSAGGRFFKP